MLPSIPHLAAAVGAPVVVTYALTNPQHMPLLARARVRRGVPPRPEERVRRQPIYAGERGTHWRRRPWSRCACLRDMDRSNRRLIDTQLELQSSLRSGAQASALQGSSAPRVIRTAVDAIGCAVAVAITVDAVWNAIAVLIHSPSRRHDAPSQTGQCHHGRSEDAQSLQHVRSPSSSDKEVFLETPCRGISRLAAPA
jgi:hypothetical protein